MRIINLLDSRPDAEDIEPPFLTTSADEDRLKAARAKMLVDLIRQLRSRGPTPEVFGFELLGELWLRPVDGANRASAKVWLDWRDRTPLRDGLPTLHYRIQITRPGMRLSEDVRAESVEDAARAVLDVFADD